MTVLDGAEAIHLDAGPETPASIVACHGFSGTPASVRPWAEHMHKCGYTVTAPRLPGHGTRWQDMAATRWPDWYGALERAFDDALARDKPVFVLGHSMGGTLALRLAQQRGAEMAGLVLCNPSLFDKRWMVRFGVPVVKHFIRSVPGIGSDIAKPDTFETSYPRVPLAAVHSLSQLWRIVSADLAKVTLPIRVFHSAIDHVVEPRNTQLLLAGIRSTDARDHILPRSYHVATLDYDAPQLCEGTAAFVAERLKSLQETS
ncbi:alpha/beta hydrolase [Stackebrandtia nassauensis]|uniref:Alpha/beta hydrolase fold protein n=1 Tax=Stackebrandtia nassauensis (strain DSM 44728 / CIP 108903 / NRRL B-16338 / NBRC 102104 / LLR-40K-21) TaxID=446470 RepID=D3Q9N2_STANL|nr:alpha/beta fold hydrolase [Stackebrandtia nassauensis]ADD44578.1 alpha/beta hydrolase fold protein [Stackebrandtia nassauensis DSM 44728]